MSLFIAYAYLTLNFVHHHQNVEKKNTNKYDCQSALGV